VYTFAATQDGDWKMACNGGTSIWHNGPIQMRNCCPGFGGTAENYETSKVRWTLTAPDTEPQDFLGEFDSKYCMVFGGGRVFRIGDCSYVALINTCPDKPFRDDFNPTAIGPIGQC